MPDRHASSRAAADHAAIALDDVRVSVLLPLPLAGAYDYLAPREWALQPGHFVAAPLGRNQTLGVVWGEAAGDVAPAKLKRVSERLDAPPMPDSLRRLVDWVASYTLAPPGAVLRMAMSVPDALHPGHAITGYALTARGRAALAAETALTPARRRVLQALADGPPAPAADLARRAGCGPGVVRALIGPGLVEAVALPSRPPRAAPDWRRPGPHLSSAQALAAADLVAKVNEGGFTTTLIDGVTGSGKTEVYFAAIAAALELGRQVLVLLPEIALSSQWLRRFTERFGAEPAQWHSDLGHAERRDTWRGVAEGSVAVVVGARSALFLPFPDLGLIIVDEEHDASFKQEDGVIYHARDMAVVRASLAKLPIVLVSATPSLETTINVEQHRYQRLHLPARHGTAQLPEIRVVDMRRAKPERQRFLAPPLVAALTETLAAGEQAMLFLNRRGYAPLTLCQSCGHKLICKQCSTWLVEHRYQRRLVCHHCGFEMPTPLKCPHCEIAQSLIACGPGVERVAEEFAAVFPDARVAIASSDTLHGPLETQAAIRAMAKRETDVLIGTQVVAKGHHFPQLTLVGIVDADLGGSDGDLRARERSFQLLHQVSGRAGRAEKPGLVLIQTRNPDDPVMRALASGDRDTFFEQEIAARKRIAAPPFGRLAA
ncbi:MAG TPA: primosomal protein N', partial [Stellaceae bacterium]|nr:primosomal protein N' [Stellaceae bacterium]